MLSKFQSKLKRQMAATAPAQAPMSTPVSMFPPNLCPRQCLCIHPSLCLCQCLCIHPSLCPRQCLCFHPSLVSASAYVSTRDRVYVMHLLCFESATFYMLALSLRSFRFCTCIVFTMAFYQYVPC